MLQRLGDLPNPGRTAGLFWAHVDCSSDVGCWPWTGSIDRRGYGSVYVKDTDGKEVRIQAHRMAWLLTYGVLPGRPLVIRHYACGNRVCCRPDHLKEGTVRDNVDDTVRMGRQAVGNRNGSRLHPERLRRGDNHPNHIRPENLQSGTAHYRSFLSEGDVRWIRYLYRRYCTAPELASVFGCSISLIYAIANRQNWKHVP